MNKQIRLLVEDLFDDLYDIEDEKNIDTEISDEYIVSYKAGDFYYQNKKPYAICCGDKEDFKDKKSRFMLCFEDKKYKWSENKIKYHTEELYPKNTIYTYEIKTYISFQDLDENGYRNTLVVKQHCNNSLQFPAFTYCWNLGDDVYLPALNELEIMGFNRITLNLQLKKIKAVPLRFGCNYLSSNSGSVELTYGFTMSQDRMMINIIYKKYPNHVRPFIKI